VLVDWSDMVHCSDVVNLVQSVIIRAMHEITCLGKVEIWGYITNTASVHKTRDPDKKRAVTVLNIFNS